MADSSRNGRTPALGSDWGGLSPHLIASFFAVEKVISDDKRSVRWERVASQPEVLAPITDSSVEATLNWQSPFENVGPDQKFSSVSALLQAGGFSSIMAQLKALMPSSDVVDSLQARAKGLEGRSNLTKLNSTQVFTGMPPLRIPVTVHFRAFQDAVSEVRAPMDQLMMWAVPRKIAPDGPIVAALGLNPELFPSEVPQIIGMKVADMLLAPVVIESIPYPLSGPRTRDGVLTHASMTIQLASLTALDRTDWMSATASRGNSAFGF